MKMRQIRSPIEVNESDVVGLQLQMDTGGDVSGKFRVEGDERINWSELNVTLLTVAQGEDEPAGLQMAFTQPTEVQEDGSFVIKDAEETVNWPWAHVREISRLLYEVGTAGRTRGGRYGICGESRDGVGRRGKREGREN